MSLSITATHNTLRSLLQLGLILCLCSPAWRLEAWTATPEITLEPSTNQVGRYQRIDFALVVPGKYTNAFDPDEVQVDVSFTTPSGHTVSIPAFYFQNYERRELGSGDAHRDWMYPAGEPGWQARFSPMELGSYQAVAKAKDRQGTRTSAAVIFRCLPSSSRGFIRVSKTDSRFLEFSEGHPFFPIGQNLAFIGSQQYVTLSRAEQIFGKLAENGANYLRVWACCDDWAMAIEARKSAWGRSWDWRPPIVPEPGDGQVKRNCLKLSTKGVKLDPSHPVALKPNTRYRLSGTLFTEGEATLGIESPLVSPAPEPKMSAPGTWRRFEYELRTTEGDLWLPAITFRAQGEGQVWINEISLTQADGGPELLWEADVHRPARGFYNPLDSFMLDDLLTRAEQQGLYFQLCLLTRDLYMDAMKDPSSAKYQHAITDARKLLRYAIARWGYSTSVAAWEYWNEMNPALPTEQFYAALGEYLAQNDVYQHLRTTSTWGPSAKDCRHPDLDVADVHFYLRPSDQGRLEDEVDAVLERSRWLREQAPRKPAHLGEFGLANEKWGPTEAMQQSRELVDVHNALWASALSGASGTALFWWWERLDQRDGYGLYRPLSKFLADVPWTSGHLQPLKLSSENSQVRCIGLRSHTAGWLWLFNRGASWSKCVIEKRAPETLSQVRVSLQDLPEGTYAVRWWDTRNGAMMREDRVMARKGELPLSAPDFARDVACDLKLTE